jgi:hypothetical protein
MMNWVGWMYLSNRNNGRIRDPRVRKLRRCKKLVCCERETRMQILTEQVGLVVRIDRAIIGTWVG